MPRGWPSPSRSSRRSLAGCTAGAPILANPTAPGPVVPSPAPTPPAVADPLPVVLPRDDGPHDRLTEWWYDTGHLRTADGRRFGFEYVIFRAERGAFPTSWASHLAITDETGDRFVYAQRLEVGPSVDRSPRGADGEPTGFDLSLTGHDPSNPATAGRPAWTMTGAGGADRLVADAAPDEAAAAGSPGGLGLDLTLAAVKPPALHDHDGWIDFGEAGSSYYYSRTAMTATGSLTLDGERLAVEGEAWFDHQWGDFISIGGGGWDWFAVNLDDGTDLTLSLVRDADGALSAGLRHARRPRRDRAPPRPRRVHRRGHRPLDEPGDRRGLPGGLARGHPRRAALDRADADGRRPGARHAGDDRGHLLGGLAGRPRGARRDGARRRGVRGADGLRGTALSADAGTR